MAARAGHSNLQMAVGSICFDTDRVCISGKRWGSSPFRCRQMHFQSVLPFGEHQLWFRQHEPPAARTQPKQTALEVASLMTLKRRRKHTSTAAGASGRFSNSADGIRASGVLTTAGVIDLAPYAVSITL